MLKRIGAEEGGEFKAVASGTLPCGRPVVVNADGTVSSVSQSGASVGTATTYAATDIGDQESEPSVVYDTNSDRIVVFYADEDNSFYGTALVGTVSSGSISFGTAVVFESSKAQYISATFDSYNNKIVVAYTEFDDSRAGNCVVGTVDPSDNSISFGSEAEFAADARPKSIAFDSSNNKVLIVYKDGSQHGNAIVGTVSGTSISFGSNNKWQSAQTNDPHVVFDSSNNRFLVTYVDAGNLDKGAARVATISSTSVSLGSETFFNDAATQYVTPTFDSTNNKVIITFKDNGDSNKGKGIIGTISSTSVSFGSEAEFTTNAQSYVTPQYDSVNNKFSVSYRDDGDSSIGKVAVGTVSGTSISFESPITFKGGTEIKNIATGFDPDTGQTFIFYSDSLNGDRGEYISLNTITNTLTSENYIGMSKGVAFQTGSADSVGSETEFVSNMGNEISAGVYDPDSSKVVLAYADQGNSIRGTAIVGTVSGTSISFGTPANFETVETTHIGITYDTTNDKVVIVYRDGAGNNNYGTAIVGTVSGTSISFGSEAVYNTALSQYNSAAFDSNAGKVVIAYKDSDSSVQSRVATVSGTSISFGTEVQVTSNGTYVKAVFDSNSNKVVIVYRDGGNSNYGTARVGTVSGTDISFGSAVVFSSSSTEDVQVAFDSTNNKIVIGYKDGGDSDKGKTVVGTVSGTSISFGSAVTFNTGGSFGMNGVVYNSNQNKVFFFYTSSAVGKVLSGTVSGTAVGSLSSEFTYHNASTGVPFQVYDVASTNIVAAYRDGADSKGKVVVFKPDNIATTRGQVTNGQAASVDVIGSVSSNQIGLTAGEQYFVQNDGTISTTADSPSVLAGTAISATELVVKT